MSKETIVKLLHAQDGAFLSGEALSAQLGISRAAIWKAVSALRRDGYEIEAVTGRGYRLLRSPDRLDEQTVRARLGAVRTVGTTLYCLASVDSTNSFLKREAARGAADGTVALADEQTGGRGRRGRSFQSPTGKGIYLSVLMRPELSANALLPLTGLGAVAVCNAVERVCALRPRIKWTNDLVLGGRKLCGILTELSVEGESGALQYVVMGIGVNVAQEPADFDGEVAGIATSLTMETGKSVSRSALAAAIIEELDALYAALCRGEIAPYLARYRSDCLTVGREVQLLWQDAREKVVALGVDDELGLIVRRADGTVETIRTGEVSVRGLYGYVE